MQTTRSNAGAVTVRKQNEHFQFSSLQAKGVLLLQAAAAAVVLVEAALHVAATISSPEPGSTQK